VVEVAVGSLVALAVAVAVAVAVALALAVAVLTTVMARGVASVRCAPWESGEAGPPLPAARAS